MVAAPQHATWQRYEAKYVVDERLASRIRAICRQTMTPDPYSASRREGEYPIHSIYLDTGDRVMARSVLERRTERMKLRVRRYRGLRERDADLPAYFEIKRKSFGIVHKTRARLSGRDAECFLRSPLSFQAPSDGDGRLAERINQFLHLRNRMDARPVISVFYTREAYENPQQKLRISFDRNLHYGLLDGSNGRTHELWWPIQVEGVILEIKFTNTYPFWVRDLIGRSELARRGICKYLMCSQASKGYPLRDCVTRCS